ncbi:class I SAM-dependent methyltransferase [Actinokineospora inagensis]|uniref:class I SAM-dependent methyltransferase n=1 Tax=Actinokineospora inagensis TaxID=103730 RepID=UPI00047EF414|nr:methyltransferase domain-containing protein [Actinokineospora inagensis]
MPTADVTTAATRTAPGDQQQPDLPGAVRAALAGVDGPVVLIGDEPTAIATLAAVRGLGRTVALGRDLRAAADALPIKAGSVAAVVVLHRLHEVDDVDATLAGFVRILAPGGRVVVAANALADRRELRGLWTTAARDCGVVDPPPFLDDNARFSLDHAQAWLTRHLSAVEVTPLRGTEHLDTAAVLALLRAQRPETAGVTWDLLASVVESRVRDAVADHGGFALSTLTGLATGVLATTPEQAADTGAAKPVKAAKAAGKTASRKRK